MRVDVKDLMLDLPFVSGLIETIYGFSPRAIEPIQRYTFDWRGIFYVLDENEQRWVLRLLKHPHASQNFYVTATMLDWLNQQGYPAPRVRRTREQQLIGISDNWTLLLLSFIEGEVIAPEPSDLRLLSSRLGQLHVLTYNAAPAIRLSRCHPETITTYTIPQLHAGSQSAPKVYMSLFNSLSASMSTIVHIEHLSLGITHGDCWYMNAIKTGAHDVCLIDWDNVGLGAPILDLGYLLLSSHFRLDDPFCIEPSPGIVQAILKGYQEHYRLSREEVQLFTYTVHFPLAYHLGAYYEKSTPLQEDDLFLRKTQQRFDKSASIAQMAAAYAKEI